MANASIKTETRAPRTRNKGSILSMAGAEEFLNDWEKIRAIRDSFWGNLQGSEKHLSQITGEFTPLEDVTSLLNKFETCAREDFEQWRRDLSHVPPSDTSEKPTLAHKNPDERLMELYESYRVIVQTKDKDLLNYWFAEQSYPMKFLIVNVFVKVIKNLS
jgi:hypothetical protein